LEYVWAFIIVYGKKNGICVYRCFWNMFAYL